MTLKRKTYDFSHDMNWSGTILVQLLDIALIYRLKAILKIYIDTF